MDDQLQFHDDSLAAAAPVAYRSSFVTRLVLSTGLAKDEQSAKYVMLGIAAVAILLAILAPSVLGSGAKRAVPQSVINIKTPPTPASGNNGAL